MQGDIFQLESLTNQVGVPKPQTTTSTRPKSGPQVAIYNEDDLSHLLYVSGNRHHHHHHHHTQEQRQFDHPADAGTFIINSPMDDMDFNTPALSDCESCSGSEYGGLDIEEAITPPLSEINEVALEAYRRKGRRNAMSFDYGFPIFLGRQDEEWQPKEVPTSPPVSLAPQAVKKSEPEVPTSRHATAIEGPMMSWWPEPLATMKHDWAVENMEWDLEMEKERLRELEREGGIVSSKKPHDGEYSTEQVAELEGRLMSWWPAPLDHLEHEWSGRFYE